jgi:MinD superfamily P-loop ATPase
VRCFLCTGEAVEPVSLTETYHEMHCRGCMAAYRASPEFALVKQLVALGRTADALSQYQHFQARMRRGHAAQEEG